MVWAGYILNWRENSISAACDCLHNTDEIAAIQWRQKREFSEQEATTNVFLAAFTTCHARLKLYEEIDRLGRDVLYMDTDSIIYKSNGNNDPELGDYLGEFTDELNGETITTFVSGKSLFNIYLSSSYKCLTFTLMYYFDYSFFYFIRRT